MKRVLPWLVFLLVLHLAAAPPDPDNRWTRQMEKIRAYQPGAATAEFEHLLEDMGRRARAAGKRLPVMTLFRQLLQSRRYRPLHSRLWLELSRFYTGSRSETLLLRALQRADTDLSRAQALAALARFHAGMHHPAVQRMYLNRLVELARRQRPLSTLEAWAYRQMGQLDLHRLDPFAALRNFLAVLDLPARPEDAGDACLGAAVALGMINKPGLQETFLKRAMDHAQKWNLKALKIRALSLYGSMQLENGRLSDARRSIQRSLRDESAFGQYVCRRDSLFRLALAEEREKDVEAMTSSLEKAVKLSLKRKDFNGFFPIIAYLADTLISRGKTERAQSLLRRMDDIYAPYHPYYFLFHYLNGRLAQDRGDVPAAAGAFRKAIQALRKNLPFFSFGSHSFWRRWLDALYNRMIVFRLNRFSATGDAAGLEGAIRLHEEKNELLSHCILSRGSLDLSLEREAQRLQAQFNHYLARMDETGYESWLQEGIRRLQREFREIRELQESAPAVSAHLSVASMDLGFLRAHLNREEMILKFMVLEKRIAVVTLGPECFRFRYLDADKAGIIRDIQSLIAPLDDFARGQVDFLRVYFDLPMAHSLYRRLIEPLTADLEGVKELIVVPDGELFLLPFDSLVTGFNRNGFVSGVSFSEYTAAEYLIQRYRVSLAFSLSHISRNYHPDSPPDLELLAFSGPVIAAGSVPDLDGEYEPLQRLAPLPSTLREGQQVSRFFPLGSQRVFSGEDFTISRFRRFAPRARVIHMATHYIPSMSSPWHSGLLFSRDPVDPELSPLLRANDVQHIPLVAELLVLSACESSDQRILGIRGMAGMMAAIAQNGVRAALVSMWPVDEYSSRLLPLFYRHYVGHRRVSDALRRAKLEFMQMETSLKGDRRLAFAHPFIWSNFQMIRFRR